MSVLQTILNNICLQEESEDISRGLDLGKCDQDVQYVHEKECNGVVDIYVASKLWQPMSPQYQLLPAWQWRVWR